MTPFTYKVVNLRGQLLWEGCSYTEARNMLFAAKESARLIIQEWGEPDRDGGNNHDRFPPPETHNWISVTERLPEIVPNGNVSDFVLITHGVDHIIGYLCDTTGELEWWATPDGREPLRGIRYWQPLPSLP